ncbi:MAG: hypothetical protein ABL958_05080, partial [Bdellovibrionia bacterium]
KSKSELLNSEAYKTEIKAAKTKLSLLIMTAANFLSNRMQDEQGVFRHSHDLAKNTFEPAKNISDQLRPIRALLKAGDVLGSDLYRWAALDGYYALNAEFWAHGYYNGPAGKPLRLDELLELNQTLARIKPLLEGESLEQLNWVLDRSVRPLAQ